MNPSTPEIRFVVLHHTDIPDPHFDFMLELAEGAPLATWRLPAWPVDRSFRVSKLPDHRQEYLEYEGPVRGGRGAVSRVAGGTCRVIRPAEKEFRIEIEQLRLRIVLRLFERLDGSWQIVPEA